MLLVTLVSIIHSFSISLGVGGASLSILNFFAAIADGKIEPSERRMMGIVSIVLRISMLLLLGSTMYLIAHDFGNGTLTSLTAFSYGQITVVAILFINAIFMAAHAAPTAIGPSIQLGSWYTLGTLSALVPLGLTNFTYLQFIFGYLTWIMLATIIVNSLMLIMKEQVKASTETKTPA